MGKVLIFIRTSTEIQELEEQKKEMLDFVKSYGYNDGNYVILEEKGASAIKLNDKYMSMIDAVKDYINSGEINCVAVWHINRLGRNDRILIDLKNIFIDNKIQFICKNPSLVLLNEDGSVNQGAELAFSLFATMVKQDMEEKKAKFKRTKKANAKKGKYNGGVNIRYGYSVDDNGYFVINEEEANIIRTIFELYSTNKYSAKSLQKEMASRGVVFDKQKLTNILSSDAYCGCEQKDWNDRVYPPIITEELFDLCNQIRNDNKIITRRGEKQALGGKLIKCVECGGTFTSNAKAYACCRHSVRKVCTNTITIKKSVIDPILWRVASTLHLEYLMNDKENKIKECKNEIEIIDTKIRTINENISKIDDKKNRVVDAYIEGLINSENKALKLNKINDEYTRLLSDLNALKEAKNRLYNLIENIDGGDEVDTLISAIDMLEEDEKNMEYKYDIIHKYITKVICTREWFGEDRDKRAKKENGIHISISTIFNSVTWDFMYIPNKYMGFKLFVSNGREWVGDE